MFNHNVIVVFFDIRIIKILVMQIMCIETGLNNVLIYYFLREFHVIDI